MGMLLVIKEDMRMQNRKNPPLVHAAQEMGFIHRNVPLAQRCDNTFVRRSTAGSHNSGFQKTFIGMIQLFPLIFQLPQMPQFAEKLAKWTGIDRRIGSGNLRVIKRLNAFLLKNLFRTVVGNDTIEVESDTKFRIRFIIQNRTRQNLSGRISLLHRINHISLISRKKKRNIVGRDVTKR